MDDIVDCEPTSDRFSQLKLTAQFPFSEVHRRNMALATRQKQLLAVSRIFTVVWSKIVQFQIEALLRRSHGRLACDFVLTDPVRSLEFVFWLEKAWCVFQQNLGIFSFCNGVLVFLLLLLHVGAQLLVANTAHVDALAPAVVPVG